MEAISKRQQQIIIQCQFFIIHRGLHAPTMRMTAHRLPPRQRSPPLQPLRQIPHGSIRVTAHAALPSARGQRPRRRPGALVIHPDELISPTLVSEAVKCPRLAVLQSCLRSTGLLAKSAVIGTSRHDLFERCIRDRDASRCTAALFTRRILRDNAEGLLG